MTPDKTADTAPRRPVVGTRRWGPIRLLLYIARMVRHVAVPALLVLAVGVLWVATPLQHYVDAERLRAAAVAIHSSEWAIALVLLVYLGASPTFFPITLLNVIVAVMYPPAAAFALALGGSMLNAGLSYVLGWGLGRAWLRRFMGPRLARISRQLGRRGIPVVVGMMVTPLGPYTLVNMVCGASHIRPAHHQIGVALGLAPTLALLVILGDSLWRLIENPTPVNLTLLAGMVVLWALGGFGLQYLMDLIPGSRRAEALRRVAARRRRSAAVRRKH
ncbi:MAG: TVP38/TMEM64 family protein [Rhodospirillales bacterium]|nr:MAG: TVP38/TMEM64 family protein [Rhodospirillales bacterium]